jgi:tryptophanyl-tRNA synthetase
MSKSLENCIYLSDDEGQVSKRVMSMFTDPNRIRADIPGKVEGNPVFIYHDAFNKNTAEIDDLKDRYRGGNVGDVEVKKKLAAAINELLEPFRERRSEFERRPDDVRDILRDGTKRAKETAHENMDQIISAMGLFKP